MADHSRKPTGTLSDIISNYDYAPQGKSKTRFSATMHQLPTSMTRMPSIGLPICKRRAPHRHRYRNSPTPSPPRHADPDRRFRCHDRQSHRGDRRYPDRAGLCNPEVPSGEGLGTGARFDRCRHRSYAEASRPVRSMSSCRRVAIPMMRSFLRFRKRPRPGPVISGFSAIIGWDVATAVMPDSCSESSAVMANSRWLPAQVRFGRTRRTGSASS
jgi:hypothetical protein